MANLSSKEIDTLIDALEAWEKKDFGSHLLGAMLGGLFAKDDPKAKAEYEEQRRIEDEKLQQAERQRKDISLLLKAKLIGMKQEYQINELQK